MNKKILENKKILAIAGIAMLVIIVIIIKIIDNNYQKNDTTKTEYTADIEEIEELEETEEEKIIVYITGEVNKEGVIELAEGSRIADAINKAEGTTENANLKNVNLAYELEDGQKIYIPNINEEETVVTNFTEGIVDDSEGSTIININKASEEELQSLNGIGESLAQSIVKYREENGNFKDIEELKNVPGIGDSKFENIKENIKVK